MTGTKSNLKVGFLGMGIMGEPMAARLLGYFQEVMIWNRTSSKCSNLVQQGATMGATPAEVVQHCDITIAMLADPSAALDVVFSPTGVLAGLSPGKGYVDMSTVSPETSQQIAAAVTGTGARFLEAPVSGSKGPATDGQLVILAAGDESLYNESLPAFARMGKKSFLLGDVGSGARMKLVVNGVMGSMMAAFVEGMALADSAGLKQQDLLDVLDLGAMANPMFKMKGPGIINESFAPAFPLKHQQKDLRLALQLGEQFNQVLPVTAAANELYKAAKASGHGDEDFSAVYHTVSQSKSTPAAAAANGIKAQPITTNITTTLPSSNSLNRLVPESMEVQ